MLTGSLHRRRLRSGLLMLTVVSESPEVPERYLRWYAPGAILIALLLRLLAPAPWNMGFALSLIVLASISGPAMAAWYLGPRRKSARYAFLLGLALVNAICLGVFVDLGLRSGDSILTGLLVLGGLAWVVTMCLGSLSFAASSRVWKRHRVFAEAGLCAHCGYDLRGTSSGRCPECGTAVAATETPAPPAGSTGEQH
jgi:hypothetical protein